MHYSRKEWPVRDTHILGTSNIKNPVFIDKSDVLLPPLNIKLGSMKQMVKAMDKTLPAFDYLVEKFPYLSKAKIKNASLWVHKYGSSCLTVRLMGQ